MFLSLMFLPYSPQSISSFNYLASFKILCIIGSIIYPVIKQVFDFKSIVVAESRNLPCLCFKNNLGLLLKGDCLLFLMGRNLIHLLKVSGNVIT